jgi:hypothetical protein
MEKIILSENHRRSVASSLFIIEELLYEIENVLSNPSNGYFLKLNNDISDQKRKEYYNIINETRQIIRHLAVKYELSVKTFTISRFIESRKMKMWEVISDTMSKRLKGYGEFPAEYAYEFDNDINRLQKIINNL